MDDKRNKEIRNTQKALASLMELKGEAKKCDRDNCLT